MIQFKKANQLAEYLAVKKRQGKKIGFVPTMGALHAGHLSLIDFSLRDNDITVCSIFINPTQFNNAEDYKHYPVTLESDLEKLLQTGTSVLFLPSRDEIYPSFHQKKEYDLGKLEHILEGKYRPGHFQGVCEVVDRLLDIVPANFLYLGQKDFQQCMVIKKLLQLTGRDDDVGLIMSPIMRERDGLAMSSRNLRLNPQQRASAPAIFEALTIIKNDWTHQPHDKLIQKAKELLADRGFHVDYIEVADSATLESSGDSSHRLVALAAATIGPIRLIDNVLLNGQATNTV